MSCQRCAPFVHVQQIVARGGLSPHFLTSRGQRDTARCYSTGSEPGPINVALPSLMHDPEALELWEKLVRNTFLSPSARYYLPDTGCTDNRRPRLAAYRTATRTRATSMAREETTTAFGVQCQALHVGVGTVSGPIGSVPWVAYLWRLGGHGGR